MKTAEELQEYIRYLAHTYNRYPILLERGEGVRVWDSEGIEYIDCVAGIAVCNLGHCHPKAVAALEDQAKKLFHCSNLYLIGPQIDLAQRLCERSFGDRAFFCNSGAEANEAAIKLARKFAHERYGPDRYEILTMTGSFHGRTMGALSATGQDGFHKGFEPLLPGFRYVPFDDVDAVAEAIGPQTCAVMVEPIQGEGGVRVPSSVYLRDLKNLCRDKDVLLIYDEIQVGMGRTGTLFAYEHDQAPPDIMTLAKSLANGVPIGATIATQEVAEAFTPGSHASTFGGNPLATRVGCAVVDTIVEDGILDHCRRMGDYFLEGLNALKNRYSYIKDVRGRGLLIGVELDLPGKVFVEECMKRGLLINCTMDTVLRFVPPLIIAPDQIDVVLATLEEVCALQ